MATIQELRAVFTAQAQGIRNGIRSIRSDMRNFSRDSQRSVDEVNDRFRNFESVLSDLQNQLDDGFVEGSDSLRRLNRVLSDTQQELRRTGTVGTSGLQSIRDALEDSRNDFQLLGRSGSSSLYDIERVANTVETQVEQMLSDSSIRRFTTRLNDVEHELNELGETASEETERVGTSFEGLGGKLRGLVGLAAGIFAVDKITEFGKAMVTSNADMETYENTLTQVMKSNKKAVETLAWANEFAAKTPFEIPQIVEATTIMTTYGMNARKQLGLVGDMASVMGKDLMQAVEAVADAQTGELERLKEFGITKKMLEDDAGERGIAIFDKKGSIVDMEELNNTLFNIMEKRFKGGMEIASTSFKGLVSNAQDSLGTITRELGKPIFEKFKKSLESVVPVLGAVTKLVQGDTEGFSQTLTETFGEEKAEKIKRFFLTIQSGANLVKQTMKGFFALFQGDIEEGTNILEKLGLSSGQVQMIINAINLIQKYIQFLSDFWSVAFDNIKLVVVQLFNFFAPYIMPIISSIVDFIGEKVAQIQEFWSENGQQIMDAAKNAFQFILAIIQFFMPAILFIVNMVWQNIKGVIDGSLKIIMGLLKIFAGLFTGDFSKMWEGIKQLFAGAIQFVWNLINLLMFGKILSGLKSFVTSGVGWIKEFWSKIVGYFKNLDTNVSSIVSRLVGYLKNSWSGARDTAVGIFSNLKNTALKIFDDIVSGAKNLPGKIGSGIKNMAGKALDGVKFLANKMTSNLATAVNGVVGGINWVLGKVGVDKEIKKWSPPEYKEGTDNHPGGLAKVGDGGKQELIITPDGQTFLSPNKDTLVNLPSGSQVISGENTELLMNNIPAYKKGKGIINSAIDGVKNIAGKIKDKAFDVWEYISDPKKLFNKAMDMFGVGTPEFPGELKDFGKGAFKLIKDKAFGFLKKKIQGFMNMGGSSVDITGGATAWKNQILKAAEAMKESVSNSELNGIIAQIQRESGGNQKITQSSAVVDVNTLNGNPARGLLQYIPQSFSRYAVKGYNNIYDGYHQLLAFFNNKNWRRDLPYGQSGWGPSGGRKINGFYEGARVAVKQLAWIAEKGAEYVIPTDGGNRAYSLWKQAGTENGFSEPSNKSNKENINVNVSVKAAPVIIDGYELAKLQFPHIDNMIEDEVRRRLGRKG
ncbi:hypothetical protein [Niallia sp. 03190]|uniref:hypothetical protein n=1 Tax=Niallia sp. 03190 TaxID=3458061 RepID=UPI004043BDAE